MANQPPVKTITGPNGEQYPAPIFAFPAGDEDLSSVEEWLSSGPTPSADTTTSSASDAVPGPASQPLPSLDVDNASLDKILEYLTEVQEIAASANAQTTEDAVYSGLPDTLADYKTMRDTSRDYMPNQCRFYKKTFNRLAALRIHVGQAKHLGRYHIACKVCRELIAERQEEEDNKEEDEQPKKKKQKKQ